MLVVLHAFSRKNAGDGLLVDLTLRLIEAAGLESKNVRVLALDPESFPDLDDVVEAPGEPRGARLSPRLVGATVELARAARRHLLNKGSGGRIESLLQGATGIVAVGGGYLVADSVVRSGGVLLNHLAQILAAGRARVPAIYLPQSIGPLRGPVAALTRRALARIDVIYARDDETLAELRGLTDVRRCPDLAVLRLGESLDGIDTWRAVRRRALTEADAAPQAGGRREAHLRAAGEIGGPTVLVPRDLPNAPGYHELLRSLGGRVPSPLWAVQADVDGPRSDRVFLRTLGVPDAGDLGSLLSRSSEGPHKPGVVVSVRLHGAIASLLAGWPAIHLSYERKGWGAYEDLGLREWVHDARSFDVDKVRAQAAELRANPRRLFERIEERVPAVKRAHQELVDELGRRFSGLQPGSKGANKSS
jgi:polysaccharide pyruvyl transferase WcaK-like protein